jgi:hypothetical protein
MSANKRIWTSQPQYLARINRGNPYSQNLRIALSAGPITPINAVNGSLLSSTSALTTITDSPGKAYSWVRSTVNPINTGFVNSNVVGHSGFLIVRHPVLSGALDETYFSSRVTANNGWAFYSTAAVGSLPNQTHKLGYVHGGVAGYTDTYDIPGNNTTFIAVGFSASVNGQLRFFVNGKLTTSTAIGSIVQSSDAIRVGYEVVFSANPANFDAPIALYFDRFLSDGDHLQLAQNPNQVFAPRKRRLFAVAAGGAAALAGNAQDVASATGALTTAIPISAASVALATATASLTTAIPMAANAADVSVASGVLITSIRFSASALAVALASAGMTTAIPLAGSAADQASASGTFTTSITLAGAAIDQVLATANLTALGNGLSAAAVASAAASGALTTAIPLAGNAAAYATAAGGLTTMIPLAGVAAAVSSATGSLTVQITFTAAALAQALAAGDLTTKIPLTAAALALASASGLLTGSGVAYPTPASRKLIVAAENRVRVIAAENRILTA